MRLYPQKNDQESTNENPAGATPCQIEKTASGTETGTTPADGQLFLDFGNSAEKMPSSVGSGGERHE
jgi:hypothetical protein